MQHHRVAFIGTGPNPEHNEPGVSYAMGYRHASGYEELDNCDLIACADLVQENAEAFAEFWGIDSSNIYEDYHIMIDEIKPDIVSITVPTPKHADLVLGTLGHDSVSAIHCEKPMAHDWGAARLMAQEAIRKDVQLTINHQHYRFDPAWRKAKQLIDSGKIGELRRFEVGGPNLLDAGTHMIDLCNYLNDQHSIEWVIGQVDFRDEIEAFGVYQDNQALALWKYSNDVVALASTGFADFSRINDSLRLSVEGSEGSVKVDQRGKLKLLNGANWEVIEVSDREANMEKTEKMTERTKTAIKHIVESLDNVIEPELSAMNALDATEVIFGAYESARSRGRVEFPLTIDDNPLRQMIEASNNLDENP